MDENERIAVRRWRNFIPNSVWRNLKGADWMTSGIARRLWNNDRAMEEERGGDSVAAVQRMLRSRRWRDASK